MTEMRRLGVFGGAFDPPHRAHVALAAAACEQLRLDALHVFPTGQAWHKARGLTPAADRLAMARIAFADMPAAVVNDREIRREGPTYTVDTLRELKAGHPQAQLFLVMGEDQARSLTSWHAWEEICSIATLCVAARAPAPAAATEQASPAVPAAFVPIALAAMPDSATEVRQLLAAGQQVGHLVPEGVARYIDQHHLYRSP